MPQLSRRAKARALRHAGAQTRRAAVETDTSDSRQPGASRNRLTGRALLQRLRAEIAGDQIGLLAAGIAFYALLAIFPALASMMAILGIFFDPEQISEPLAEAITAMPASAAQVILDQAAAVTGANRQRLGVAAGIGLLVALYSTARGMRHLIQGLNVAFDRVETRSFLRRWTTIVVLSVFAVGGVVLGLGAIAVIPIALAFLPLDQGTQMLVWILRWVALFAISVTGIAVIYRWGPDRPHARWHWTVPGAMVACLLWVIASAGFSLYAENFASYQRSFGALAGVIVLLTWLWLSAYILLLGAELNAMIERTTERERGTDPDEPDTRPDGAPAQVERVPSD